MVKHIVDTRQFKDRLFLDGFFPRVDEMKKLRWEKGYTDKYKGKIIASFFYQPSTRTKLSFDAAAKRLGADIFGTENAREFSSAFKGETLEHSLMATQECFDAVVMRHNENGTAKRAASVLQIPFINAGDGTNQHPTQALLDTYTVREHYKRIENLKVVFVGDNANSRTVRSLAYLLSNIDDNELTFVSPEYLKMPGDMKDHFNEHDIKFYETDKIDDVISDADVLYVTRFQWEYEKDEDRKKQIMNDIKKYQITRDSADKMKYNSIIMHPLPINTEKSDGYPEISSDVDTHPRAHYFRQSNNGLYVRMALLDVLLNGGKDPLYDLILPVP